MNGAEFLEDRTLLAVTTTSFTRETPATSPTNADTLVFRATFSMDVTGVDAADFAVTGTTATIGVSMVTASTYNVTVSGGNLATLNGTVGLNLNSPSIMDLAANALPNTEPGVDETYVVDNALPTAISFTRQSPSTNPTNADTLVFRATFSEGVTGVSAADFAVTGTTATIGVSMVTASTYDVTVTGGDLTDLHATVGLNLNSPSITDLAGNVLPNTEPGIDETFTVENSSGPQVDVTAAAGILTLFDLNGLASNIKITLSGGKFVVKSTVAELTLDGGLHKALSVCISMVGITGVSAELGLGNDKLDLSGTSLPSTVSGGAGNDTIIGSKADDKLNGDAGDDSLKGGKGNDLLVGGSDNDVLSGGDGTDRVEGGDGQDKVKGDAGDDTVSGGAGTDSVSGGDGMDLLFEATDAALVTVMATKIIGVGTGSDAELLNSVGMVWIEGGPSQNMFDASASTRNMTLFGGAGNDTLIGGNNDDRLYGQEGNDSLNGNGGDDTILGGDGNDFIQGGKGDDVIDGGDGDDHVEGEGGADAILGGAGNDTLLGGEEVDTLLGEAGVDSIDGGGDKDFLTGGGNGIAASSDSVPDTKFCLLNDAFAFNFETLMIILETRMT